MTAEILVGRQPIYDDNLNVIAYELLYRDHPQKNSANILDGDKATSQLILNTFLDIGLDNIVGNHPAFINFTRNFILDPDAIPFDKNQVVLEILEDVEIDDEVIHSVKRLHEQGYSIALDDYIYDDSHNDIMDFISIIKIDILGETEQQLQEHVSKLSGFKGKLLAEKIENQDEYEYCKQLGFDFYQGFFLSRPKVISGQRIPTNRLSILEILSKLYAAESSVTDIKDNILNDVSLSYRLLRYLNSSFFGLARKIESIDEALVYLGLDKIRKWVTLISLSRMQDKPNDIITTALVRARMCELVAERMGLEEQGSYFTVGLFSNLPALLDMNMQQALGKIPISESMKQALIDHSGQMGEVLKACIQYQETAWDRLEHMNGQLSMLRDCYLEAIAWSNEMSREMRTD